MEIAKVLKADGYFAHPYHSWERGLNENTNGFIRQYQPKGTDFNKLTDRQVLEIMDKLNNRPRKCLGYKTPNQVFFGINPNVINLSLTVFFDTASGIRGLGLFSCLSGTCVLGAQLLPHRPYAAITAMRGPVAKFPRKA